ncbi:sigma factor G inhibitor Gin [Metabacillus sp. GX 13764]|uniref:sigma factor G inhibitor Gin n=1 Tax=Metabacillus kandeliae TaxID=2900151 RepID=UPI001E64C73F|nr:sigma factor G inhibitor Gin [Metabacillus kandeliae]MCD7036621.1 sigma factor G inhibitor Gin [Metabacillus kandeliae]
MSKDQMGNQLESCIVCEEKKPEGIHLYTSFICHECEAEMVRTKTDEPRYSYFIDKLKRVKTPPLYS